MTLTRIERLVRRVRGVLQGSEAGGGQVAVDFAEVCREANRRIEECAGGLRRGDLAGSMDLAEAEPPLAQQIRVLMFPEATEWVKMCREQGWSVPETPDWSAFQKLQKAFQEARNREIDPNLLQAFRAAMVAGDRPAALRVLATVLRRRPGDAWATGERAKLLAKESETKLRKLETLLRSEDLDALVRETDEFDQLGLDPSSRPEIYEQANQRRREHRREMAREKAQREIPRAQELRSRDQWREVEILLEEVGALLEETGARPPAGHAWQELHGWVNQRRADTESREQLRREEEAVLRELGALEEARSRGETFTPSRLRESFQSVRKFLEMGGAGGATWPEAIFLRLRKEEALLAEDLARVRRRRWWLAGASLGAAGILAAAGLVWNRQELRNQATLLQVNRMIENRDLDQAQAWRQSRAAVAVEEDGRIQEARNRLDAFMEKEKQLLTRAEAELDQAEQLVQASEVTMASRWEAWEALETSLAKVHRSGRESLLQRREKMAATLREMGRQEQKKKSEEAGADLRRIAGQLDQWEGAAHNRPEDLVFLQGLGDELRRWQDWRAEKMREVAMPEAMAKEFDALSGRIEGQSRDLKGLLEAWTGLERARSLEDYQTCLGRLVKNPRLPAADLEKISKVLTAWKSPEACFQRFWLPWLREQPVAALAGAGSLRLAPASLSGKELDLLEKIVKDDYLNDLWQYEVPYAKDDRREYLLYSQGEIKEDRLTKEGGGSLQYASGEFFIPWRCNKDQAVQFESMPKVAESGNKRIETEKLLVGFLQGPRGGEERNSKRFEPVRANLEKALTEDTPGPLARAPIQEALDQVVPASPGTSPLARAYLTLQIWELANASKDSLRFGLIFGPSLLQDAERWRSLGPVDPGGWLRQEAAEIDPAWQGEMNAQGAKRYADEAKLAAQLFDRARKAGLQQAGWIRPDGSADLSHLESAEEGQMLFGQDEKGEWAAAYRRVGKEWKSTGAVLRPFSPLAMPGEGPRSMLEQAVRAARVPPAWAADWTRTHLPELFGKLP